MSKRPRDLPHTPAVKRVKGEGITGTPQIRTPKQLKKLPPLNNAAPESIPGSRVVTAGTNGEGQMVQSELVMENRQPKQVDEIEALGIKKIAAGDMHAVALAEDDTVVVWGNNDEGACGTGPVEKDKAVLRAPEIVKGLPEDDLVVMIGCGTSYTMFLTRSGAVYRTGTFRDSSRQVCEQYTTPERVKDLDRIVTMACGCNHALFVSDQGILFGMGVSEQGQLSVKQMDRRPFTEPKILYRDAEPVVGVACMEYSSFYWLADGSVYSMGLNNYGQLGLPHKLGEEAVTTPELVEGLDGRKIVKLVGGQHHTLVLLEDGSVLAMGRQDSGQCGRGVLEESLPVPTLLVDGFTPADLMKHTIERREAKPGFREQAPYPSPDTIDQFKVKDIDAWGHQSILTTVGGAAFGWGFNGTHALGMVNPDDREDYDGDDPDVQIVQRPRQIASASMAARKVVDVAMGAQFTALLLSSRQGFA